MARKRPQILKGNTTKKQTGCGPMYVTINDDEDAIYELFASLGKGGGCASAQVEAICRMASLAFRCGATHSQVVKQLSGISCPSPVTIDGGKVYSCGDALAQAIKQHMAQLPKLEEVK